MDDFRIDASRWRLLDDPRRYVDDARSGLKLEPLARQFRTAKEILTRLANGRGALLADDVGLGKTTVGAVVAWAVASQDKRVRIYAPNEVLRRRWAEELERHAPMFGAANDRIKQGDVGKLNVGRIQVATHRALVKSHGNNEQRTACDLMIIDEAHRAKGDGSAFNEALRALGRQAKRKLILTATPFSIRLAELNQLLEFVGATELDAVAGYAAELKRLYSLGDGFDVTTEATRLVSAAKNAVEQLRPYVIRHGIDDLSKDERKHFGEVGGAPWDMPTPGATQDDLALLLRMDRLLQLTPERKGERRNDPRFHIGWQHLRVELKRTEERASDPIAKRHIEAASNALAKRTNPHPKIAAVSNEILPVIEAGEKVLVFCHHRATAREVLSVFEETLKMKLSPSKGPPAGVWRAAWESVLAIQDSLVKPIIDWLCTPGLRAQVGSWIGEPGRTRDALVRQLEETVPRKGGADVPTVAASARSLTEALLDTQSTSTRALLNAIAGTTHTFAQAKARFPGHLDDGQRVMGVWHHEGAASEAPETLYTGKPDIVLAIFNSPFGPDVLVATDMLSEGVDLHRCCRHLVHYELDPSPVRTLQRNGRVRRVGSWAALTKRPIQYGYPTFGGTRDQKAVGIMRQRVNSFGLLLGGVPHLNDEGTEEFQEAFADAVLRAAREELERLNRKLSV